MITRSLGLITIPVALTMLSCGDAVSPPAEGALSISFSPSPDAPTGYGCDATGTLVLAGESPTPTNQGITWVDGQASHSIDCKVKGNGTYEFSGTIFSYPAKFSIDGTVTRGGTGTAVVSLFDPGAGIGLGDTGCTVEAVNDYKVEKGAIWAGVECRNLTSRDYQNNWCRITGTFVFKSCDD